MSTTTINPKGRPRLRSMGTPATIVTFVVVAVSGLMRFLHVGEGLVRELHKWLSIAFVIASVLHLVLHWQTFLGHFRKGVLWIALAVTAAISVAFVVSAQPGDGHGPNGMRAVFRAIETVPIENLVMVLGANPVELVARLEAAGMKVEAASASLAEVAHASKCSVREVIAAALNDL